MKLKSQARNVCIMIHNKEPNGESKHFMIVYLFIICHRKLVESKITLTIIKAYNLNKNI